MKNMIELRRYDEVLYDADQTLVNSGPLIKEAFNHTMTQITGRGVDQRDLAQSSGGKIEERYAMLVNSRVHLDGGVADALDRMGEEKLLSECVALHLEYQRRNIDQLTLFPGTMEVLELFRDIGVKQSIVTNRPRQGLFALEVVGLTNIIKTIVAGDDVLRPKPRPDGILQALARSGVSPDMALMVGDSWRDVRAGKNAGVHTVGALWGEDKTELIKEHPTYFALRMRDLRGLVLPFFLPRTRTPRIVLDPQLQLSLRST